MNNRSPSFWFSSKGLSAIMLIVFAGYFLLVEHRQHLFEFLPYLIILACPLMHFFMHRGHGHRHSHRSHQTREKSSEQDKGQDYLDGYQRGVKDAENHQHHSASLGPRKDKESSHDQ